MRAMLKSNIKYILDLKNIVRSKKCFVFVSVGGGGVEGLYLISSMYYLPRQASINEV